MRATTDAWRRAGLAAAAAAIAVLLPTIAAAQTGGPDRPDNDMRKPNISVSGKAEQRSGGYDVVISVRATLPGIDHPKQERPEDPAGRAPAPAVPAPSARPAYTAPEAVQAGSTDAVGPSVGASSPIGAAPSVPQTRTWVDGSTIHQEAPDGQQTVMTPIMATVWSPTGGGTQQQLRQAPEQLGYYTYINGQYQGITWQAYPPGPAIPPQDVPPLPPDVRPGGGGGLDPYSVAMDILAHIPLPDIKLRANPNLGLVALPSWYWAEGYGGQAFGESRTVVIPPANPNDPNDRGTSFTVEVMVWGSRYDWAFGDGNGLTTRSLGRPYPAESDIQHTYEHSSLPFPAGFPVRMTAEFAAEFRVNGGGPQGLPPVRRTYENAFRVQEIQPVLVQRR